MILDATVICKKISELDVYYSYPYVYYYVQRVSPYFSESPLPDSIQVTSYCINVHGKKLVVQYVDPETAIVDAVDESGDNISPLPLIDTIHAFLVGRHTDLAPTPHEVEGISRLFLIDEDEVRRVVKYAKLVKVLEDRFASIIGNTVYVFSRNPSVVFTVLDGEDAVKVAMEKSIVSHAPIRDMREHIKSFLGDTKITVFIGENESLFCSSEKCITVPVPRNTVKLITRDLNSIEVDLSKPARRKGELVFPSDYILFSRNILLINKTGNKYRVVEAIDSKIRVSSPLLFSKQSGFVGFAYLVSSSSKNYIKVVRKSRKRGVGDIEEFERITATI